MEYIPTFYFDAISGFLTLEDVEVIFDKSLSEGDAYGWCGPLGGLRVKTLDMFGLDNSNAWRRHLLGGNIAEIFTFFYGQVNFACLRAIIFYQLYQPML
jgi:hypothetical protein